MSTTLTRTVSAGAGRVLGTAVGALSAARPAAKPMHPRGTVASGRLHRHGGADTGAAFLDDPGVDTVLVRWSRSIGLPTPWPDVAGLALRIRPDDHDDSSVDVLMSTTGHRAATRWLLRPTVHDRDAFLGTLLPYRSPTGPVLLGARAAGDGTWTLLWARPLGTWRAFGVLGLLDEPGRDLGVSFDATRAAPPGLVVPGWHRRLRAPSYAAARRSRRS
jgi:hypothetical protein